jgi:RimJ/RimL family protein N-acetyltransferase
MRVLSRAKAATANFSRERKGRHDVHHEDRGGFRAMDIPLTTDRLIIRDWSLGDAEAALAIYGSPHVAHWLTPAMDRVGDVAAMRSVLQAWQEARPNLLTPRGRRAVQRAGTHNEVIGGLGIRLLPPYEDDLEVSWQLNPEAWGKATRPRPAAR